MYLSALLHPFLLPTQYLLDKQRSHCSANRPYLNNANQETSLFRTGKHQFLAFPGVMVVRSKQLAESHAKKPDMVKRQIRKVLQVLYRVPLHTRGVVACLNSGFWTEWLS